VNPNWRSVMCCKRECDCGCQKPARNETPEPDCDDALAVGTTAGSLSGAAVGMAIAGPPGAIIGFFVGLMAGGGAAEAICKKK
jgi:hypothetical protein